MISSTIDASSWPGFRHRKNCDNPYSFPPAVICATDRPPLKTETNTSSTNDSPEPFQKPTGTVLFVLRILAGSVVNLPSSSYPPATGSSCSFNWYCCNFPYEYCDIAMSKTICPSFLGTAITNGLFPSRASHPPHGGIFAIVLVAQMPMQPASAACHPYVPPRIQ